MKRHFGLIILLLSLAVTAQDQRPVVQGQTSSREVSTVSRPIETQQRKTTAFEGDGVFFSNEFDGARLNRVERTGELSYTIFITPENAPINPSPWYAFKVRASHKRTIRVKLEYPVGSRHRYSPLTSHDGEEWKPLDATNIEDIEKGTGSSGLESRPKSVILTLKVGKKPLWVSAQELQNSSRVFAWMDKLAKKKKLRIEEIGKSTGGKPLRMVTVGDARSKRMVMVISRQHPPEVTGYFAMQAFVEELLSGSKEAKQFRKDWGVYIVPLMNPDGVDNGHWRHNNGGIDLNRDWAAFNQPETSAVRDFLKRKETETGGKFYFGIDFHSTWDDVYYPMSKTRQGSLPGLIWEWLDNIKAAMPGYTPNIQPSEQPLHPTMVSRNYFLAAHGMEAIVFEIGDNTSREFIRNKGKTGAAELVKLLIRRQGETDLKAAAAVAR